MNVLMVGVDHNCVGGMWSVAENFLKNDYYVEQTHVQYVATATSGSLIHRVGKMLSGYAKIIRVLHTGKIDLLHVHMAEKGSTFRKGGVVWLGRRFGCKIVVQMHAGPFMAWYDTQGDTRKKIIRKILNTPDKVLVLGKYWEKAMVQIVPSKKMEVLYNGVLCPAENPYQMQAKNILYLGVMKKAKGIFDLLAAFQLIAGKLPEDCFLILGGTDPTGEVSRYIREKHLENRVKMPGWISGPEKSRVLQEAAVLVQPSYFEGLSMSVIEAMAYGVPVVATGISTMPEVLGTGAELVKPGEVPQLARALLGLIQSPEKRRLRSAAEFSRAGRLFSMDAVAHRTVAIYRTVLGKTRE